MIALGGPKLKLHHLADGKGRKEVSMIALGGPKLKLSACSRRLQKGQVSMIALGGPKLKHCHRNSHCRHRGSFNDSTGWA